MKTNYGCVCLLQLLFKIDPRFRAGKSWLPLLSCFLPCLIVGALAAENQVPAAFI